MHDLDSALDVIRARDDTAAKHAHALWHVMRATAAHPTKVTRYDVQQMVWRTLPGAHVRPGGDGAFEDLHGTCDAFAELLHLLGHERYAEVCRSPVTHRILDAAGDPVRYPELVARAWAESGVQPPDTPVLTWSDQGGPVETALHAACGRLLEEAVEAGTLPADGSGEPMRVGLVMRLLTSPEAEGEETWFARLLDERLDAWIPGRGSQTRREMLVRLRPEVRRAPETTEDRLPALLVLLESCRGAGARLTASGYLPTALVASLAAAMPACRATTTAGRSESHWPPVALLRTLAESMHLVERTAGRLRTTDQGTCLIDDADSLLMTVGERLITADRTIPGPAAEAVLAALLLEDRMAPARITEKVGHVLSEEGLPGDPRLHTTTFLTHLRVLDATDADATARRVGLTPAGRALARWSLRARVLFPTR
ncbi:hypothetical protein [Actinokineospora bangkokensis]|uniref:Uncharacterized protein n=1 Tax=Actinokineospora bangkokensis TaxID=1193682 RepID=A0A1Q9LFB6_9PSEU|nr:hypothetical protein [Actinokineospora bangkokensis]OLR90718.1 hypothetical protein BJP25_29430 [Actinokineospora bangkokensis]